MEELEVEMRGGLFPSRQVVAEGDRAEVVEMGLDCLSHSTKPEWVRSSMKGVKDGEGSEAQMADFPGHYHSSATVKSAPDRGRVCALQSATTVGLSLGSTEREDGDGSEMRVVDRGLHCSSVMARGAPDLGRDFVDRSTLTKEVLGLGLPMKETIQEEGVEVRVAAHP